jgi:NADH-quinone oxidoreductase subunit M
MSSFFEISSTPTSLPSGDLLIAVLIFPLVSIIALLLTSAFSRELQYRTGLATAAIGLVLSVFLAGSISIRHGRQETFVVSLLPSIPVSVAFGIDGISLPFILLTTLRHFLCVLSLSSSTPRLLEALVALTALEAGVIATFCSLDLLAFFLFFERTLLPIYFLVLI